MRAEALARARFQRDPRRVIEAACAGGIDPRHVERPQLRALVEGIARSDPASDARASLRILLLHVHDEADFLFESTEIGGRALPYVNGLIKLNDRRGAWVATLRAWKPTSHNPRKQFGSLARYLTARFHVPVFMDEAWLDVAPGTRRLRDWFVHIGSGRNIRTAKTPVKLTKTMAHHFIEAPGELAILDAMRWGQIHALGGDDRLARAVLATRVGAHFTNDDFWSSVLRFFVANPMLHRRHVGPIVDYLDAQKFQQVEVIDVHGMVRLDPPPQPGLSMRGRTANALLAQVERWHDELGRTRTHVPGAFPRSGHAGYRRASANGETSWQIRELSSQADLVAEGKALRHCVASYAGECAAGRCSIWTLEWRRGAEALKLQTIEVSKAGSVVQCRGRYNRPPSRSEYDLVAAWARAEKLVMSAHLPVED